MRPITPAAVRVSRIGRWLLGLTLIGAPAPTAAQQLPWVGLAGLGAERFGEEGGGQNAAAHNDHFGWSVAAGDFNGDGADDLAAGVPHNDCDLEVWDCGAAVVRWGVPGLGLGSATTILDQIQAGSPDPVEHLDELGWSVAAGDFNGDGRDDLAVGVPNDQITLIGGRVRNGAVQLHFGSAGGVANSALHFAQTEGGIPGAASGGERFGHAVTFGDFNGDGRDDLAVGVPRNYSPVEGCSTCRQGSVMVIDRNALGEIGAYEMVLGDQGLPDTPENGEDFGFAVAAGDFNGDGFDDLAIGVPSEDDVGAVLAVYGSPWSLLFANHWYFGQWDLNATTQAGERFGEALATGDFDGDGFDDLAVGIPKYDGNAELVDIGLATVVYGAQGGLGPNRVQWLWEDQLFGGGNSEAGDLFGSSLTAGDFDGDGVDDLAIGTMREGYEDTLHTRAGAVTVIPGRHLSGLTGAPRQLRPRQAANPDIIDPAGLIPDRRLGHPEYGSSLAAGDFDGNGFDDLAIGAPGRDEFIPTHLLDIGGVAVLYGQLFADGFETGSAGGWSSVAP